MTPFRSIAVFYHVANTQSVVAAAEHLNVTPSAVSQQIRALEEQVGTTLVTKSGRKLRLTESGERYFELISEDVEHIIKVTDQLRGVKTTTLLIIRATPTVSTKWLLPRLRAFLDANPDMDIRLDGSNEPTDFNRDNVDLEIRHGTGRWPGLHVQPLVEENFFPVCSPALAAPRSLETDDLQAFRLIHSVKAQVQWRTWFAQFGQQDDGRWTKLYFDRSHMSVDAAVLGMGIALESNLMMARELQEGKLIIPTKDVPEITVITQWLVCPNQNLIRPRVRRFMDWITDAANEWREEANIQMP